MLGAPALASSAILAKFTSHYDNSSTRLSVCKTCMDSTSPPASWNSYGAEMRNFTAFYSGNPIPAMQEIEHKDSDGDGFSNIKEITNSTFPGNMNDNPTFSDSTVTEPAATNTIMNAFVTIIVILIVTFLIRMKN
jgi:hypothetical protein